MTCPFILQVDSGFPNSSTAITTISLPANASSIAFLVHARLVAAVGGGVILPVMWSDNYVTLRPGDTRVLTVNFNSSLVPAGGAAVFVESFNDYL